VFKIERKRTYFEHIDLYRRLLFKPLMPQLNPSAQGCLTRFFTGDFASLTVHFVNVCVKNQQIQQLFIQFIIMCGISYMFRHYIARYGPVRAETVYNVAIVY
jgi:hypothetical protein